jgi:XisH protein
LGADLPLAAEKEGIQIAVEIKGFQSPSDMNEWEKALGQFFFYDFLIEEQYPTRVLYIALPEEAYQRIFQDVRGVKFIQKHGIRLVTYSSQEEKIIQWIPSFPSKK